jgi:hypothetical protein
MANHWPPEITALIGHAGKKHAEKAVSKIRWRQGLVGA